MSKDVTYRLRNSLHGLVSISIILFCRIYHFCASNLLHYCKYLTCCTDITHSHKWILKLRYECTTNSNTVAHLAFLGPKWRLQLTTWQKAGFQTGEKGQKVTTRREVEGRPLDPILTNQNQRPTTIS